MSALPRKDQLPGGPWVPGGWALELTDVNTDGC